MRLFNSLQLVGLFAGWPYLLNWLSTNPFPHASIAFWTSCVFYLIGGCVMVAAVHHSMDKNGPLGF